MLKRLALLGPTFLLFCCAHALASNVLVVVMDDVGADVLKVYRPRFGQPDTDCPPTPTIDSLAAHGVTFLNAWANPWCAATRASMTFGRYGLRTGVGIQDIAGANELGSELTVPEILPPALVGVGTAMIGKWGISADPGVGLNSWADAGPIAQGFGYARSAAFGRTGIGNYCYWAKVVDAAETATISQRYATTDNVHDAIEWINEQKDHPWILHLAFNAPHSPYHVPPYHGNCAGRLLHTYSFPATPLTSCDPVSGEASIGNCPSGQDPTCYRAMIQALDTELGCLLDSITDDVRKATTVIVVGDNGTPLGMVDPPLGGGTQAKGSVSRGGTQVPLIVSGEQVAAPGRMSDTLVNAADIFATAAEILTGLPFGDLVPASKYDSTSFLPTLKGTPCSPARNWIYAEVFHPSDQPQHSTFGWKALRGPRYKLMTKLVRDAPPTCTVLYDLIAEPLERCPLVRDGTDDITSCGLEARPQGNCSVDLMSCDDVPDCVRLRDQMKALIHTAAHDYQCDCATSTNFCAGSGVRCSFDGTCGLSGFCNSACASDMECNGPAPASLFPANVALVPACLGG